MNPLVSVLVRSQQWDYCFEPNGISVLMKSQQWDCCCEPTSISVLVKSQQWDCCCEPTGISVLMKSQQWDYYCEPTSISVLVKSQQWDCCCEPTGISVLVKSQQWDCCCEPTIHICLTSRHVTFVSTAHQYALVCRKVSVAKYGLYECCHNDRQILGKCTKLQMLPDKPTVYTAIHSFIWLLV